MSVAVRPMVDQDDLAALDADDPDGWIVRWWQDLDREQDPPFVLWFVGSLDGEPAGFAAALRQPAGFGGYGVGIVRVLQPFRRRGVGTALLAEVERTMRDAGLPGMLLSRVEGVVDGAAAAAAWGLLEVGRHRDSELDLTRIDRHGFAARADVPGVELRPLPSLDLVGEEGWSRLHDFFAARVVEAPDLSGGGEAPPPSIFRSMVTDPWAVVVAEESGRLLGLTMVTRRAGSGDAVNTFFTGVSPDARGRGIATALKCRQALLLADAGITRISTQNLDGNAPILAANRTLGFVPAGGHVDVVRTF